MEVTAYEVMDWLYGLQRKTKQALGRAESRPGVTHEELDALNRKLAYIDKLIGKMMEEL